MLAAKTFLEESCFLNVSAICIHLAFWHPVSADQITGF